MAVIYEIINTINNMCYIGQTRRSLKERLNHHKNEHRRGTPFYHAIKKYGWENFTVNIIEECEIEQLNEREIYWIAEKKTLYPDGYNLTIGGNQCGHHQLTREKISRQRTGMKFSESHKESMRRARLGTKASEETKRKMSIALKGKRHKEETKIKLKYSQPHRREVGMFDSDGNLIQKYDSIKEAARELSCNCGHVSECCNGKRKMKSKLGDNTLRFL